MNEARYTPSDEGVLTLCQVCNKAIQLLRTRNPETGADIYFWVHCASLDLAGPAETHKAIRKGADYIPPGHSHTFIDQDGDERCECGKWLEPGYYEMGDHLRSLT